MLENRDVRLPAGKSNDDGATHRARRRRRPTRPGHGQGHGQARPHAAEPLLEVPQADAVRTRSLSALRIGVEFGDPPPLTLACPECGPTLPAGSGGCPLLGGPLGPSGTVAVFWYSSPGGGRASRPTKPAAPAACGSPSDATSLRFENRPI